MIEEPKYTATLLADLLPKLLAENDTAIELMRTGRKGGPISGFMQLDEAVGGFFQPGLHILQAAPGDGKTAMALQIAASCECPAVYISTEMPVIELFRRLISRTTNTFLGKLKTGEIPTKKMEALAIRTIEVHPHLALVDATRGWIPLEGIQRVGLGLRERFRAAALFIVLDSLQYWARGFSQAGLNEYELISEGVRRLSELGAILTCPILAVSHRNRQGNRSSEGGMHSAKGSGDIEYACESLLELSRVKDLKLDDQGSFIINLAIYKNRHGESGKIIPFAFSGRIQKFTELEKEDLL